MNKYFTLVVTLVNEETVQYKNLTESLVKEAQEKIWIYGIKRKINHTTTELICPLVIRKAIVVEQIDFLNE